MRFPPLSNKSAICISYLIKLANTTRENTLLYEYVNSNRTKQVPPSTVTIFSSVIVGMWKEEVLHRKESLWLQKVNKTNATFFCLELRVMFYHENEPYVEIWENQGQCLFLPLSGTVFSRNYRHWKGFLKGPVCKI